MSTYAIYNPRPSTGNVGPTPPAGWVYSPTLSADCPQSDENSIYSAPYPSLEYTQPLSVCGWFKFMLNFNADMEGIMTKTTSGELSGYFIQTNEGGFEYGLSDSTSNGPYALTATTLVESLYNSLSWFHIAMTYDGSNTAAGLAFYLNGVLQTPSEQGGACITSTVGNNPLILVNDPDVYGAVTHMRTSNVSIWNIALSPTQVGDVYGNGHPPDLSLLSYFSSCNQWYYLGNGDNTTVFDHGSAGINLTKSSDVTYVNDRP